MAIIPARGGSKGIPRKNVVDFCGKPLLAWSLLQARAACLIDSVYVSTDDAEIAAVARRFGAHVIDRPFEISGDTATSESALLHAVNSIESGGTRIDLIVFLQATSPLRESGDIDRAIETFHTQKVDSLFSAVEVGDLLFWRPAGKGLECFNRDFRGRKRRQDYTAQYLENGSLYVMTPEVLRAQNNRLGGTITFSLMDLWKMFEIDSPEGLELCRMLFRLKKLNTRV